MALFHTTVVDNQIKALDTIGTASGAICTFDTDRAERLVKCVADIDINATGFTSCEYLLFTNNMWSEQWEVGSLSASGAEIASTTQFRNIGFIPVKSSLTLYIKSPFTSGVQLFQYDNNKTYIRRDFVKDTTITLQATTKFIRFRTPDTSPVVYDNDISINYDSTDTNYNAFDGSYGSIDFGESITGGGTIDILSGLLTHDDDTTKNLNGNVIQSVIGEQYLLVSTGNIIDLKFVLSVGKAIS